MKRLLINVLSFLAKKLLTLIKFTKSLFRLFNFTKDEWKKINASGTYETLLNGIEEAKEDVELSKELLKNATKLIYPTDSENTIDKTNLALAYSKKLKEKISNLKNISASKSRSGNYFALYITSCYCYRSQ